MAQHTEERNPGTGIRDSFAYGWQQLKKNFVFILLLTLFLAIAEAPASLGKDIGEDPANWSVILQLIAAAYSLLIMPVFTYGGDLLYVRAARNEELEIQPVFEGFRNNYVHIILSHLIVVALVVFGLIFLIIPGIIIACRLAFVSYLVMDKNLEPIAAIEKSWDMTRGYGWKIFGMGLLSIFLFIIGLICLIIGAFVAVMWIKTAFASLYHAIDQKERLDHDPYLVRE